MNLKVLKYAHAALPKLFDSVVFGPNGRVYLDTFELFYSNLRHNEETVSNYIYNLNKISDCDTLISEFRQISELLDVARLKGMNLIASVINEEEEKRENQINKFKYDYIHEQNISKLKKKRYEINEYCANLFKENTKLWVLAINKRTKLIRKEHEQVKKLENTSCVIF